MNAIAEKFALVAILSLMAAQAGKATEVKIETVPNVVLPPNSIAFSPDGLRVAAGQSDGTVNVLDWRSGRMLRSMKGHINKVSAVVFLANGRQILSASEDKTVRLWEASTGEILRTVTLNLPGERVASLAISPDGSRVLTGTYEKEMKLWDAATGRLVRSFPIERKCVGNKYYSSCTNYGTYGVAFSPDGTLAVGGTSGLAKVWDLSNGKLLFTLKGDEFSNVLAVGFSTDGARIFTGGGKTVRLWDAKSGQLLKSFVHSDYIYNLGQGVVMSSNNRFIFSAVFKKMTMWDVASGRRVFEMEGTPYAAQFTPDAGQLLLGSWNDTILGARVLNAADGRLVRELGNKRRILFEAIFSKDGSRIIAGGTTLTQWDASSAQFLTSAGEPRDGVLTSAYSADATRMLRRIADDHFELVDAATGATLHTFKNKERYTEQALSPDGSRIAMVSPIKDSLDSLIELIDASNGRVLRTFKAQQINAVEFSSDGKRILSGNFDKTAKLWDAENGRLLQTLVHSEPVWKVAFSPDGSQILTGDTGKTVTLWDAATGRRLRTFDGHTGPVYYGVAFSWDGSRAMSASDDKTVKLWDVATGRLLRSLNVDSRQPAFSPDGTRAFLGGAVWNLDTGEKLVSLYTSANDEWLAITPEGFFAASANAPEILSVVRGFDVYSIDQFYQSLYRPDLVREKLAGDPRGLVREAATKLDLNKLLASGNAPAVSVISPRDGERTASAQVEFAIDIAAREGGIGRVEWRINGITIGVEQPAAPAAGQPLRLTRSLLLDEGDNEIEAVAYNAQNLVASEPARATVTAPAAASAAPPRLFMLAVGLNEYEDKEIQLKYAVPDATALAEAIGKAGGGVYESVNVTILKDAEVRRAPLASVFTKLATEVRPTDVFVFFIAGHGKTVDGRYYFIPQDIKLDGVDSVVQQGIAQEEWQRWFAAIPARKSVLLFDTCESGSLTGEGFETRALERGAASDRLLRATGRTILTATSDTADAFEGYRGHGLFTYNLLDALGSADSDGNGSIEVPELAAYVHAQVTALSEKVFQKRQVPQVRITGNYPIAKTMRVLADGPSDVTIASKPTHMVSAAADLLVQPVNGARRVRKLDAKTPLTLVRNEGGWTLVAREGRPVGYVATRDLSPIQ